MNFDEYQFKFKEIENNYYNLYIIKKNDKFKSSYFTDGQVSHLLGISEKDYKDMLKGKFKTRYNSNKFTTYIFISKNNEIKETLNEIKKIIDASMVMNKLLKKEKNNKHMRFR
ncbi:MAG: hypothetical protein ACOC2W_04130 [bacterium]